MMTVRDFHNQRSRFSSWQVEIFMMTDRIFMIAGPDFIMNGGDFCDDRSRFYSKW